MSSRRQRQTDHPAIVLALLASKLASPGLDQVWLQRAIELIAEQEAPRVCAPLTWLSHDAAMGQQ